MLSKSKAPIANVKWKHNNNIPVLGLLISSHIATIHCYACYIAATTAVSLSFSLIPERHLYRQPSTMRCVLRYTICLFKLTLTVLGSIRRTD